MPTIKQRRKSNKSGNRPSKAKSAKQPTRPKRTSDHHRNVKLQLVRQVCGITDPFCKHAVGAKFPDDSNSHTLPGTFRWRVPLVTDANGVASLAFVPNINTTYLDQSVYLASITTGSDFATFNQPEPGFQQLPGAVHAVRVVSAGFKAMRTCAPLTTSGTVFVRQYNNSDCTGFNTHRMSDYSTHLLLDTPLQDSSSLFVASPHTAQAPSDFYDPAPVDQVLAGIACRGFGPSFISILGGPASTEVMSVEFVIHYELMFQAANGLGRYTTPPPPYNPTVTQVAARVSSGIEYGIYKSLAKAEKYVVDRATAALTSYAGESALATAALSFM